MHYLYVVSVSCCAVVGSICHDDSTDDFIRSSDCIESIEHARITLGRSYEATLTLRSCTSIVYSTQTSLHCKVSIVMHYLYVVCIEVLCCSWRTVLLLLRY
jgi:hypothetical protein